MVKNGKTKNGVQRYRCKECRIPKQKKYLYLACLSGVDNQIVTLVKEGVGARSISRMPTISPITVLKRILQIASTIRNPPIFFCRDYEVDEMITFIGNKENGRICIAYAIERETRQVIGFGVGRRNKSTLRQVINTLILSEAKQIRTDKCPLYINLIPKEIHYVKRRGINYIERMNLTLRTHIKRLNRRTIAYSKSMIVLSAVLKIYFWS